MLFIKKLISGQIGSPALRNQISLNSERLTIRNPQFIRIKFSKTEAALNSPFNLACRAFNFAALQIDPTLNLPDIAYGDLSKA